jgi:peroxiredoxin-like protein
MQDLPHEYVVTASADTEGSVVVASGGLDAIVSAPPAQFGGPGTQWSPEDMLVAAVADCLVLTFRAIARASKLPWGKIECRATGTLDRVDRQLRFTRMDIVATLSVPAGTDVAKAERLLEKAEQSCLITNTLNCERHLDTTVQEG